MNRLDRYILSSQLRAFGFFALVLVGVNWIHSIMGVFDALISDGQSLGVFVEITALMLPGIIYSVVPSAALIATLYVTNRLINDSELVVARASGWSAWRLSRGVFWYGVTVAGFLMVVGHMLLPASSNIIAEKQDQIARDVSVHFLDEGVFQHPTEGVTFFIREISERGELLDIFLSDHQSDSSHTIYTAKRAILIVGEDRARILMSEGMVQTLVLESGRLSITRFEDLSYDVSNLLSATPDRTLHPSELSTLQLLNPSPAIIEQTQSTPDVLVTTAHLRFSQPAFSLIAALLCFTIMITGRFNRLGNWRQIVLSVAALLALKSFDNYVAGEADNGEAPWPILYVPLLTGLVLNFILIWLSESPYFTRYRRIA